MAGTAREEAERLVATVLAMAAQSGLGGAPGDRDREDDTLSGTARRLGEGLSAFGDAVAGFVGHLTGGSGGNSADPGHPADPGHSADPGHPADPGHSADPGQLATTGGSADAASAGGSPPAGDSGGVGSAGGSGGAASPGGSGGAGSASASGGGFSAGGGSGAHGWAMGTRTIGGRGMVGWATGSAECCVCPLCRVIAGLRDPSPEIAERLATGAGDFATGVASLLRAVSAMTSNPRPRKPARQSRPVPDPDTAWTAATRTPPPAATLTPPPAATLTPPPAATRTPPPSATRTPPPSVGTQDAGGRPDVPDELPIPDGDGSPWSAATRASDREARAADLAARAARRAQRLAEQETRRIEQEARRIEQETRRIEQETHRAEQEVRRADQEVHPGTEQAHRGKERAADRGDEEAQRAAADPRTIHGFESPGADRNRPAAKADVWAAATADTADRGVAPGRNVDHDVPGAPSPPDQAETGSTPAEAAGSPEAGADGDARAGGGV
jgi:hypothetical protein